MEHEQTTCLTESAYRLMTTSAQIGSKDSSTTAWVRAAHASTVNAAATKFSTTAATSPAFQPNTDEDSNAVPTNLLRAVYICVTEFLSEPFNRSLQSGRVLECLNSAYIVPPTKKSDLHHSHVCMYYQHIC